MMSSRVQELSRGSSNLTSPSGRLNVSLTSPRSRRKTGNEVKKLNENDDNGEKELMRISAKTTSAKLPPQVDLSDHYSMCLKLSAENKISIKNAFNLCLIDYMVEELFKEQDVDFNLAAYSLDASSKIYSCRIDGLRSKVFRCMNALTMKGGGKDDDEDEDVGAVEGGQDDIQDADQEAQEAARKAKDKKVKKRKKKKTTLTEGDTKSITFDIESINCQQIDPLFDKVMQIVKVSCCDNLFLSTILPLNDTHRPIFHSDDPIHTSCGTGGDDGFDGCLVGCGMGDEGAEMQHEIGCPIPSMRNKKTVNIERLRDTLLTCAEDDSKMICSAFRSFEFDNEDATTMDELKNHRYDGSVADMNDDDNDDEHLDGLDDDFEEARFNNDISGVCANLSMQDNLLNSKNTSRLDLQQLNKTINSIKEGDMSSLKAAMISGSDGDACFKEDFLKIWSGPNLWKERGVKSSRSNTALNKAPKPRKPKDTVILTFDDDVVNEEDDEKEKGGKKKKNKRKKIEPVVGSMEWHFQSSNRRNGKIGEGVQLLPEQYHTTHNYLTSLFVLEGVKLEVRQTNRKKVLEVPAYDLNNTNDKLNYCPPPLNDNSYDDDNVGGFDSCHDDNNNTLTLQHNNNNDHDSKGSKIFGDDNDFVGVDDDDDDILTGSRLLPQPEEVTNLKIDFSKIAKNVDVKVMKETMIKRIQKETTKKENNTEIELSRLFKKVRMELPTNEAENYSVAMAVSCLLQIANEKNLVLEASEEMNDVMIHTKLHN